MHNSFGKNFTITSFGESHGELIGVIVDGCPSGLKIDIDKIQEELNRRRPGQSKISTSRSELDKVLMKSGINNDRTTGAPICLIIENRDKDSSKYDEILVKPRPSHADYPAIMRYGKWVDLKGSGRFSGRNTAGFVMAGAIAKQLLSRNNIKIAAYTKSIHDIIDNNTYTMEEIISNTESNPVRTVDKVLSKKMEKQILDAKEDYNSVGGIISCVIEGVQAGIGEPMFNSVESEISRAIFSIPAVKGIEFGIGFKATRMMGSEHNDCYDVKSGKIITKTNNSGGIIGGITTGMPITFNVAIKPTASIGKMQDTVNIDLKEKASIKIEGRHDPCIVPRAVPVIEAMAAIVIVDLLLETGVLPKIL